MFNRNFIVINLNYLEFKKIIRQFGNMLEVIKALLLTAYGVHNLCYLGHKSIGELSEPR